MFEHQRQMYLMTSAKGLSPDGDWDVQLLKISHEIFRSAQRKARWHKLLARFGLYQRKLCDLGAICITDCQELYELSGVRAIELDKICGSEGRCMDFDGEFLPLHDHMENRWSTIAALILQGQSLPAVELIRAGEHYFIRDGHHRVSVARCLGQRHIDARVTVWDVMRAPELETERAQAHSPSAEKVFSFAS